MRKWLVLIGIIALILAGICVWLASKANDGRPEAGEVRIEIDTVL